MAFCALSLFLLVPPGSQSTIRQGPLSRFVCPDEHVEVKYAEAVSELYELESDGFQAVRGILDDKVRPLYSLVLPSLPR